MIRNVTVTGGAGFIGSHVVEYLVNEGCRVTVIDNFRSGRFAHPATTQIRADITTDHDALMAAIDGADWVVHLAANPDARGERRGVQFNLDQNITGTNNVLNAMQHVGADRILYASSASVYGNAPSPVTEDCPFPVQASFYGASKIAGEGLVSAYCEMNGWTGINARWVHILGERYLHGHIIDFIRKLRRDSSVLPILGDGNQAKSGLYAPDLAAALWTVMNYHDAYDTGTHVYNFGGDTMMTVRESAERICQMMDVTPTFIYSGRENGGWVGDNPSLVLDSTKIRALGWTPTVSVPEAHKRTVEWLLSDDCDYA